MTEKELQEYFTNLVRERQRKAAELEKLDKKLNKMRVKYGF